MNTPPVFRCLLITGEGAPLKCHAVAIPGGYRLVITWGRHALGLYPQVWRDIEGEHIEAITDTSATTELICHLPSGYSDPVSELEGLPSIFFTEALPPLE